MTKIAMHPQNGVLIIFHDQLNVISKHLADIKLTNEEKNAQHQKYLDYIIPAINLVKSTKKKRKLT